MKRVRCPKCERYVIFDENRYKEGQNLVFECPNCGKQFSIRIGVSKLNNIQREENLLEKTENNKYGYIVVIENVFHYKQIIPLNLGENVIGRHMKGSGINCPIETNDPSIDMTHCSITVKYDKNGSLKYILKDGPSNTGTFVDNDILGNKECRIIKNGSLFTIGATSIILHTTEDKFKIAKTL